MSTGWLEYIASKKTKTWNQNRKSIRLMRRAKKGYYSTKEKLVTQVLVLNHANQVDEQPPMHFYFRLISIRDSYFRSILVLLLIEQKIPIHSSFNIDKSKNPWLLVTTLSLITCFKSSTTKSCKNKKEDSFHCYTYNSNYIWVEIMLQRFFEDKKFSRTNYIGKYRY